MQYREEKHLRQVDARFDVPYACDHLCQVVILRLVRTMLVLILTLFMANLQHARKSVKQRVFLRVDGQA